LGFLHENVVEKSFFNTLLEPNGPYRVISAAQYAIHAIFLQVSRDFKTKTRLDRILHPKHTQTVNSAADQTPEAELW
jgi:hypothetical protein